MCFLPVKKTGAPKSNAIQSPCRPVSWTSERVYQLIYKLTKIYNGLKRLSMVLIFFYKIIAVWIKKDKKNAALRQHFNLEIIGFEPTTL